MRDYDELTIVLQLIDRIEETVAGHTALTFRASNDAIDAVTYRLSMIGEHCKRLPDTLRDRYPDVPWRAMAGLRNIVVHGYDNVSPAIVWQTATQELGVVREMALAERQRLDREEQK